MIEQHTGVRSLLAWLRRRAALPQFASALPFNSPGKESSTLPPLLDEAELRDLRNRVRTKTYAAEHVRDVAHRPHGDSRSVYRGYGLDYEESRPYQSGDELRFMNWRLSARTGQPYMKVFREERRPGVFILIDRRGPMRFGTRVRLKAAQALRAAAIAAFQAERQSLPVGGVILDHAARWLAGDMAHADAFALLRAANHPCPPVSDTPETINKGNISIGDIYKTLAELLVQGSRVYLISDFVDSGDADLPSLLRLGSEHQIYALHIHDPGEAMLPALGDLCFVSQDGGRALNVDTAAPYTRLNYTVAAERHMRERETLFASAGIAYRVIETSDRDIENLVPLV